MKTNHENLPSVESRNKMNQALSAIDEKLKSIKEIAESPFKTNGEFRFNPSYSGASSINIHKTKDVKSLISIYGFLNHQNNSYNNAQKDLDIKDAPAFEWMGFTFESWKHDLKTRSSFLTQYNEIERLKLAKTKLEAFMTEEDRLNNVLKELQKII